MPELPDITVYVECLRPRVVGHRLDRCRIASPFVLRSVSPAPREIEGRRVKTVSRLGKRIVLEIEDELFAVIHLMIAGRLRWLEAGSRIPARIGLAAFDFDSGSLLLTEVATKKRASLHLTRGAGSLAVLDRGGVDVLSRDLPAFRSALLLENHTLKRALTDPRLFDGIGNAYSDEILHAARLSPTAQTHRLDDVEIGRLFGAARSVLTSWIERLRAEAGDGFPQRVTAFREGMAVHGRFRQPCPVCGTSVQRIVYAENEANYCPRCQTGGKLLADRALSRQLKSDWPGTIDELEAGPKGESK
jgi:formamidopyrimidine-DNA glycosylase